MPAQYEKSGLSFMYPENWTLDEEKAVSGNELVTVYSPEGGFWSVSVYHGAADPVNLANSALEAMKEEYKDLEVEEIYETVAGRDMIGYNMNFFLLDFTNTAQIRILRCNRATYTILCQADDLEFRKIERVFQAITISLLNGLKELGYWGH
jgi:hypothetical protein